MTSGFTDMEQAGAYSALVLLLGTMQALSAISSSLSLSLRPPPSPVRAFLPHQLHDIVFWLRSPSRRRSSLVILLRSSGNEQSFPPLCHTLQTPSQSSIHWILTTTLKTGYHPSCFTEEAKDQRGKVMFPKILY